MGKFSGVRKVPVSERVGERIAGLILDGTIRPGDRLPPEHELMRQFNVGRSSVREAVRGLVMVGVLEAKPGRGTVVVSPVQNRFADDLREAVSAWALRDLFEVRMLLEEHAVGRAALEAEADDIAEIDDLVHAIEAKVAAGKRYFDVDTSFHLAIARASHNNVLQHALRDIIGHLKDLREHITRIHRGMPARDVKEHREIVEAIRARNPARGRKAMRKHLGYYLK
jgi:GntR family transcriptional repressor for pyruvate dehydrogenase complex